MIAADPRRRMAAASRRRAAELGAALLAGLGAGVAIAAVADGSGVQKAPPGVRPGLPAAAHTREALAPASAGTQPGRSPAPRLAGAEAASPRGAGFLRAGYAGSFRRLREGLPGRVELSLAPLGGAGTVSLGGDVPAHGWSTMKVPVVAALLQARGKRDLTVEQQALARSAITASSNEAILALFADLERSTGGLAAASEAVQELFSRSGDERTVVATAPPPPGAVTRFGQTLWRPSDAVKFFSAFARHCLVPRSQADYVLELMQRIEPSESWGLGDAGLSPVAFKGGWGPEGDGSWVVRQSGVIHIDEPGALAVSIVAFSPTFEEGVQMLTRVAQWLSRELRFDARPAASCVPE